LIVVNFWVFDCKVNEQRNEKLTVAVFIAFSLRLQHVRMHYLEAVYIFVNVRDK